MAVESTVSRSSYIGNNTTDTYDYGFKIFSKADLLVTLVSLSSVESTLIEGTDYSVSGVGVSTGGNITLTAGNLSTGVKLVIRRQRPLTQIIEFRNQGDYYAQGHEDALDKAAMVDQQQQDEIGRTVKNAESVTSTDFNPTLPADLVGAQSKAPITNATGDGWADAADWPSTLAISTASQSALNAALSAAAALVSENNAKISENAAALSESNASASEIAAGISEGNAFQSETNAATSEGLALGSKNAAAISEGNAYNSELAAGISEGNAAVSEGNASGSEIAAAASAVAAEGFASGIFISADQANTDTGNIDSLSIVGISSIRFTGAVTNLRGLAGGENGKIVFLNNASGSDITVDHEDATPSAANRIVCPSGADFTWKDDTIISLKYDSTDSRWKFAGGAGGGDTVITSTSDTTMAAGSVYVANSASRLTFTLPSTAAVGDTFKIYGLGSGGWNVHVDTGQSLFFGEDEQVDTNGSILTSYSAHDSVEIVCTVADTTFQVVDFAGGVRIGGNYWGDRSDGAVTISSNTNLTSTSDSDVIVKNYSSLTIDSSATLTVSNRCRGLWIYVDGDCTINGTLSMTARGASANPTGTPAGGIRFARFKSAESDTLASSDLGTDVGAALISAEANQLPVDSNGKIYTITKVGGASNGTLTNGTGGGGSGVTSGGAGGSGTCFSGGAGGGGQFGNPGSSTGGTGGAASGSNGGGGAGNPGGPPSGTGSTGSSGTGGLLVLFVKGDLTIGAAGTISANGSNGGAGAGGQGGGSGGGRIIVLHAGSLTNSGTIVASGGGGGGSAGAGAITTEQIAG